MKRPAQNLLAVFASDAVARLLGFVTTAFMARVLDPASFGTINFGMAVLSYGVLFSSPGLHIIGALRVADASVPASLLVRTITTLRALLALVFCCIACATYLLGEPSPLIASAFFFSIILLPLSFQLEWYFQGREALTIAGIGKIAGVVVFAAAIFFALSPHNYHWFVPLCYGLGMIAQAALLWVAYLRTQTKETTDKQTHNLTSPKYFSWREALRQALPVGAAVITAQALLNFPSLALGIFSTTVEVAHFSATAKLVFFVLTIDRMMYSIFFPFVARVHANAPQSLPGHLERIAKYLFLICVPICVGGFILAPRILEAVYGTPYTNAAPVLQIQLLYFFFTILNSLFSYPLIATGHERYYGLATTIIAVATIVLLLPLIYFFSSIGASAGLVIGEIALVISMAVKAGRLFPPRSFAHSVKPIVSSIAMAYFLWIFSYIPLVLLIPLGAIVYILASASIKAFDTQDINFVKERLL